MDVRMVVKTALVEAWDKAGGRKAAQTGMVDMAGIMADAAIAACIDDKPQAWLIPVHCAVIGDPDRAAAFEAYGIEVIPLYRLSAPLPQPDPQFNGE